MRQAPIRKSNPERAKRVRDSQFGTDGKREWIISLPCATCGKPGPSDPSHVRARGMGGVNSGPEWMIPQCRECHSRLDSPGWGVKRFEAEYGVDLAALARQYADLWNERRAA